eukprot:10421243-Lingulodinium_polyedra.AAC.1
MAGFTNLDSAARQRRHGPAPRGGIAGAPCAACGANCVATPAAVARPGPKTPVLDPAGTGGAT